MNFRNIAIAALAALGSQPTEVSARALRHRQGEASSTRGDGPSHHPWAYGAAAAAAAAFAAANMVGGGRARGGRRSAANGDEEEVDEEEDIAPLPSSSDTPGTANPLARMGSVPGPIPGAAREVESAPAIRRTGPRLGNTSGQRRRRDTLRMLGGQPPELIPEGTPPSGLEIDVPMFEIDREYEKAGFELTTPGVFYHERTQMPYRLVGVLEGTRDCLVRLRVLDDVVDATETATAHQQLEDARLDHSAESIGDILLTIPIAIDDDSDLTRPFGYKGLRKAPTIKALKIPYETEQEIADHIAGMRGEYVVYYKVINGERKRKVVRSAAGIPRRANLKNYRVDELVMISKATPEERSLHPRVPSYGGTVADCQRFHADLSKHKNLVLATYAKYIVGRDLVPVSDLEMVPAAGKHWVIAEEILAQRMDTWGEYKDSANFVGTAKVTYRKITALTNAVMFGTHHKLTPNWSDDYHSCHLGCEGEHNGTCTLYTHVTFGTAKLNEGLHKKCPGHIVVVQPGGRLRAYKVCRCDADPSQTPAQLCCMKMRVVSVGAEVPLVWVGGRV